MPATGEKSGDGRARAQTEWGFLQPVKKRNALGVRIGCRSYGDAQSAKRRPVFEPRGNDARGGTIRLLAHGQIDAHKQVIETSDAQHRRALFDGFSRMGENLHHLSATLGFERAASKRSTGLKRSLKRGHVHSRRSFLACSDAKWPQRAERFTETFLLSAFKTRARS